jgi:hypothetical protein
LTRLEVINFHLWLLWSTNWDPTPCAISSIRTSFYAILLFGEFPLIRMISGITDVSQNCSVLHLFRICLRIVFNSFHIFSHTKLYQNRSLKCKTWPKYMN